MDGWSYQGIELRDDERPATLLDRICRLEGGLGLSLGFQAVGTFRAPMSKANPPRYSPKGSRRRFLHLSWQVDSAQAWPVLLHVAQRDGRAILSSFTGAGFLARDIDPRDGHPRESILLAAFTSDADDFLKPLESSSEDADRRQQIWQADVERESSKLANNGVDSSQLATASRWVLAHRVRFDLGWYLASGDWRSRYVVQSEGGHLAIAAAQQSLCTCASRHPETLQLMMPSDGCIHHLAARLVDVLSEVYLDPAGPP